MPAPPETDEPETVASIHTSILSPGDIIGVRHHGASTLQHHIVTLTDAPEEPIDSDNHPDISLGPGEVGYARIDTENADFGYVDGIMHSSNIVAVDHGPHFNTDPDDYEPTWDIVESDVQKAKAMLRNTIETADERYGADVVEQAIAELGIEAR